MSISRSESEKFLSSREPLVCVRALQRCSLGPLLSLPPTVWCFCSRQDKLEYSALEYLNCLLFEVKWGQTVHKLKMHVRIGSVEAVTRALFVDHQHVSDATNFKTPHASDVQCRGS
jgi:hypothetical protein